MTTNKKSVAGLIVFVTILIFVVETLFHDNGSEKIKGHIIGLNADVDMYKNYNDDSRYEDGDTVMLCMHELKDRQWILRGRVLQKDTTYVDVWSYRHRGSSYYPNHKVHFVKAIIVKN